MTDAELDSFVSKFKQLCAAGLDAHLAAGSHAGKAWVSLRVGLGQPDKKADGHRHQRNSPSRQRRRARREVARRIANSCDNGQTVGDIIDEEAVLETEKVSQNTTVDVKKGTNDNPLSEYTEIAAKVKISVTNVVIDEIKKTELDSFEEEELVMVFREYTSEEAFNHEKFFGEVKSNLSPLVSYFHYDGTYWKENEKTTGFYQTVKMKAGLYRRDLSKIENWPAGKILIEFKRKKRVIYALF